MNSFLRKVVMENESIAKLVAEVNSHEMMGDTHSYSYFYYPYTPSDEDGDELEGGDYTDKLVEKVAILNQHGWRPVGTITRDAMNSATVLLERPLSSEP